MSGAWNRDLPVPKQDGAYGTLALKLSMEWIAMSLSNSMKYIGVAFTDKLSLDKHLI